MAMSIWVESLVACGASALSLCALSVVAPRVGLIDHPGERRKIHRFPVPLIGGIAIFLALILAYLVGRPLGADFAYGLLGGAILVVVGSLDDRFALGYKLRLLAQTLSALFLAVGAGVHIHSLGNLLGFGPISLGVFAVPFTVVAIVGIVNAFNMIDGIDGLAGTLALVVMIGLLALIPQATASMQFLLPVVIAATLPYLACNLGLWGRKAFLGDAGSMLLGYIVVWALIDAAGSQETIAPVTALWLVAVPLLDTINTMARRIRRKRSPFYPDRGHLHHVVMRASGSTRIALVALFAAAVFFAGIGLAGESLGISEPAMFYAALAVFLLYARIYVLLHPAASRLHRARARARRLQRQKLSLDYA